MGRLATLVILCLMAATLCGCQGNKNASNATTSPPNARGEEAVKVIVEGGGQFPESLVGTWRAPDEGWEFVFEPNGTISSAVISLGRVRIKPGQTTTVPTITGGQGVFKAGQWSVHYVPVTRELTVKIVLESLRIEMGDNILEGKSTDVFVGTVSQTADAWQTEKTSFPQYTAHTAEHPTFELSADPVYGDVETITFEKVLNR